METATTVYKGHSIIISLEADPRNPREEFDHLGTMFCWHKRHNLGEKHAYATPGDFEDVATREKYPVVLPLYLYDHGGLTMRTRPFDCPWDSGQVGWIFVTREQLLANFRVKRPTKRLIDQAKRVLISEVETYDAYLRGEVYRFKVLDPSGEEIDAAGGFYGADEYILDRAKEIVDANVESVAA